MFLIRTAFWLTIVVLLLPTDERQQSQIYGTAKAAVQDVTGFCGRNPETCAKSKDVFDVFVQKAQFGAKMLMGFMDNGQTEAATERATSDVLAPEPAASEATEQASWQSSQSQDTLRPEDLEPIWGGPRYAGT